MPSPTKEDLERAGVTDQVLKGISFALDHVSMDDYFDYADGKTKGDFMVAEEWYVAAKRALENE